MYLSKKLEIKRKAIRLCPDEWIVAILENDFNDALSKGLKYENCSKNFQYAIYRDKDLKLKAGL